MLPVRFAFAVAASGVSLDQVPHLGNETVRVHVDRLHTTTADGDLTTLAWRSADLAPRRIGETMTAHEQASRGAGRVSDEVSAIRHVPSSALTESNSTSGYGLRATGAGFGLWKLGVGSWK